MRISEIVIVPGAGHLGPGTYSRGHALGMYAEVDLVDTYVQALVDELDGNRVRHRVLDTRTGPGVPADVHLTAVYPGSLVLVCGCGWNAAKKVKAAHNASAVTSTKAAAPLARDLAAVLGHWGGLYVFGHRTENAAVASDPFFPQDGFGIRLEPLQVNGPSVGDYGRWLGNLGRDIGRHLAEWLEGRGAVARATTIADYLPPAPRNPKPIEKMKPPEKLKIVK